jgi:hypothetical protein
MSEDRVPLQILVRPSPQTNDHEVVLLGGGQDLVARFGVGAMGLDPDDLLVEPCPLIAKGSDECLIGRCDCGVIGCGDVRVRIVFGDDVVSWSGVYVERAPVHFDLKAYEIEVGRALHDHSWETPDRTVSRLIASGVDREVLARAGLKFSWASGRSNPGSMTVALWLEPGPYQVLVHAPWSEVDPPGATAGAIVDMLAEAPSSWQTVVWFPQAKDLRAPALAGAGWRRC